MLLISILAGILNGMLVVVAGTDAVAAYTAGWRVVMLAVVPIIAIGTALIPVAGAAYGAKRYWDLSVAYRYATKVGIGVAVLTAVLTFVFAPEISVLFAYSPESASLAPTITAFLQVMCLFYLFMPPGFMASSIFQAVGRGMTSLSLTLLRELIFVVLFAYLFAFVLDFGEPGIWWGIVAGDMLGSLIGYTWGRVYVTRLGDGDAKVQAPVRC
jgi:Na+-driven multidrug efflux pump